MSQYSQYSPNQADQSGQQPQYFPQQHHQQQQQEHYQQQQQQQPNQFDQMTPNGYQPNQFSQQQQYQQQQYQQSNMQQQQQQQPMHMAGNKHNQAGQFNNSKQYPQQQVFNQQVNMHNGGNMNQQSMQPPQMMQQNSAYSNQSNQSNQGQNQQLFHQPINRQGSTTMRDDRSSMNANQKIQGNTNTTTTTTTTNNNNNNIDESQNTTWLQQSNSYQQQQQQQQQQGQQQQSKPAQLHHQFDQVQIMQMMQQLGQKLATEHGFTQQQVNKQLLSRLTQYFLSQLSEMYLQHNNVKVLPVHVMSQLTQQATYYGEQLLAKMQPSPLTSSSSSSNNTFQSNRQTSLQDIDETAPVNNNQGGYQTSGMYQGDNDDNNNEDEKRSHLVQFYPVSLSKDLMPSGTNSWFDNSVAKTRNANQQITVQNIIKEYSESVENLDIKEKELTLAALPRTDHNAHFDSNGILHLIYDNNSASASSVLKQYDTHDKLGEGTYGVVFRAFHVVTREVVALKHIRFESTDEGTPSTAIREVSLLRILKHPNIVSLIEIALDEKSMILVFEFLDQDLHNYIESSQTGLDNITVCSFLYQLLIGLQFCHSARIYHRDLKPQNLLINFQGELKLADFGLARSGTIPINAFTHEVVTLWYRPPDVILGNTSYTEAIDLWGVGCIFAEMFIGKPLVPGSNPLEQLVRIFKLCGGPNHPANTLWDPTTLSLWADYEQKIASDPKLRDLLVCVPQLRSTCKNMSPVSFDLLARFLQYDEHQRITSEEALRHPYFSSATEDGLSYNLQEFFIDQNFYGLGSFLPPSHAISGTQYISLRNLDPTNPNAYTESQLADKMMAFVQEHMELLGDAISQDTINTLNPSNVFDNPLMCIVRSDGEMSAMYESFDIQSRSLESKRVLGRVAREYHLLQSYEKYAQQRWQEELGFHHFTFDPLDFKFTGKSHPLNYLVRYANEVNGYVEASFIEIMGDYCIGALMDMYNEYAMKYPVVDGGWAGCVDYFPTLGDSKYIDIDSQYNQQLILSNQNQSDEQNNSNNDRFMSDDTNHNNNNSDTMNDQPVEYVDCYDDYDDIFEQGYQIHQHDVPNALRTHRKTLYRLVSNPGIAIQDNTDIPMPLTRGDPLPHASTLYYKLIKSEANFAQQLQYEYQFIEENWLQFRAKAGSIVKESRALLLSLLPTVKLNAIQQLYTNYNTFLHAIQQPGQEQQEYFHNVIPPSSVNTMLTEDQFNWLIYQSTAGKMTRGFYVNTTKGTLKDVSYKPNNERYMARYNKYVHNARFHYLINHSYEGKKLLVPEMGPGLLYD